MRPYRRFTSVNPGFQKTRKTSINIEIVYIQPVKNIRQKLLHKIIDVCSDITSVRRECLLILVYDFNCKQGFKVIVQKVDQNKVNLNLN